jgi:hypothetical protein
MGASGTINLNGYLSVAEYNRDLVGTRALTVYDRMVRSDGTVQEALEHLFSPIKNATWTVEPASDDPEHLEHAEFVRRAYFDWAAEPWLNHLDHALDYLAYGHQVFEVTYQVVEGALTVTVPDEEAADRAPEAAVRHVPSLRAPSADDDLEVERRGRRPRLDHTAGLQGARLQTVDIPAEDHGLQTLIVYTNKRRGDEFTGRSILRAAYKAWTFKELIEKVAAIAVERHGVGLPIGYPPEDAKNDSALMDGSSRSSRPSVPARSRSSPPRARRRPRRCPAGRSRSSARPGGIPDFTNLLEYQRAEIKASVLARFAELGHASVGARATGDVQSIVWYAALHAAARYVADVHQPAIRKLVDANYVTDEYPRLVPSDIEVRNLAEFAQAHAQPCRERRDHPRQELPGRGARRDRDAGGGGADRGAAPAAARSTHPAAEHRAG